MFEESDDIHICRYCLRPESIVELVPKNWKKGYICRDCYKDISRIKARKRRYLGSLSQDKTSNEYDYVSNYNIMNSEIYKMFIEKI